MSSGGPEERITDFVPGGILLELTLRLAAEENFAACRRHFGVRQDLGKIVDEHVALQRANPPHFFVSRPFEIDVLARKRQSGRIEEAIAVHPSEGGCAQVGQMWIVVRELGLVTDDRYHVAARTARLEKSGHAVEQGRRVDPPAIDEALQALPEVAVRLLGQQGAFDGGLAARERRRQQALLLADARKGLIVADQRVVEIDADSHGGPSRQTPLVAAGCGKPANNSFRMSPGRFTGKPSERAIFSQESGTWRIRKIAGTCASLTSSPFTSDIGRCRISAISRAA